MSVRLILTCLTIVTDPHLPHYRDCFYPLLDANRERAVSYECRRCLETVQPTALADHLQLLQLLRQSHHIWADVAPIQSSSPRCKYCIAYKGRL